MAGILLEGNHVTDEERAAHTCALAAKEREKSLKRATEVKARVGAQKLGRALQFPGRALSDRVVEPGPFSCKLAKGNHLRIIDLEGQQAVDFLVYDAANHENRYNAANTIKINRSDLKLEYRPGYYAPADYKHSTKEDRERQLEEQVIPGFSRRPLPGYVVVIGRTVPNRMIEDRGI